MSIKYVENQFKFWQTSFFFDQHVGQNLATDNIGRQARAIATPPPDKGNLLSLLATTKLSGSEMLKSLVPYGPFKKMHSKGKQQPASYS